MRVTNNFVNFQKYSNLLLILVFSTSFAFMFWKKMCRLISYRMSLLLTLLSKISTDFSTQQYRHVEFSFKFLDKNVNKSDSENS